MVMATLRASSVDREPVGPVSHDALRALNLGLRFLALAVVAAVGAVMLQDRASRLSLAAGVLGSTLLAALQHVQARGGDLRYGPVFLVAQAAIWTYLLHVSGGQRSPLFVGLLLEVPLAASVLGRMGCIVSAAAGAAALLSYATLIVPPPQWDAVALAIGFIALTALVTWLLAGVLDRQRAAIAASRAALAARAENLAAELRLLGDYLGAALVSLDEKGCVARVNPAGAALLAVEPAAAIGHPWQEVLRPDVDTAAIISRTLAEGEPQRDLALLFHRADGRALMMRGDLWSGPAPGGRRTYMLFDQGVDDRPGDDPVRRLGEAAACVAHQIKNSLQALRAMADLAVANDPARPSALDAERFRSALGNLNDLAEDVLGVAGTGQAAAEEVPLAQALSSAVLLARPGSVRVELDHACEELRVCAHRGRLVHALYNLLDNACRVTPPGGTVRVSLRKENDRVHVDIVDHGPGLPPGVEGSAGPVPSKTGAGLGLVAARRFLSEIGGTLSFAAAPGGGTLCRVSLSGGTSASPQDLAPARG